MICFEAHIDSVVVSFLEENQKYLSNIKNINDKIKSCCGIIDFFPNQESANELLDKIQEQAYIVSEPDRREYGDFQTNTVLTSEIVDFISEYEINYEFVLEPTCGKGNFIISALKKFPQIKRLVGVEIYQPYVWETKFKILSFFISEGYANIPIIEIIHANTFDFPFEKLANETGNYKSLIIGNPPWVTNSELSSIDSKNLLKKSNFKKHKGLEAITGKGNFDIGEFIATELIRIFQNHQGNFAFLVKNSVIKNIIADQKQNNFLISENKKLCINAKKEFNVSVNAALLLSKLGEKVAYNCTEYDFYTKQENTIFGWYKSKFVFSTKDYEKSSEVDGKSSIVWRSGIKHDCSKIMEFERINGHYFNGLKSEMQLEENLVYGLLKSSDLRKNKTNIYRKLTIVTQNKIGQDTKYIKESYPLTYQYLMSNKEFFNKRKSSIYKDKPLFSIFGVGDYSFAPYKVAISGLYKSTHFTLVTPEKNKPIMLDDTCYFIGFEKKKNAEIAHYILNSGKVHSLLKAITFSDAKRAINKDTLMRIDLQKAYASIDYDEAEKHIENLTINDWKEFKTKIDVNKEARQMTLF